MRARRDQVSLLGLALAVGTALAGGCAPKLRSGQFACSTDRADCPVDWECRPFGIESRCVAPEFVAVCGNGVLEPGEQCEPDLPSARACGMVATFCIACEFRCPDRFACGNGQREANEECDDGNAAPGDGCSGGCLLESLRWEPHIPPLSPPPRSRHAMAYDAAHARVVLFGGRAEDGTALDDTWVLEGSSWRPLEPVNPPGPRYGHALAYDEARGVLVLFGGQQGAMTLLQDTWELAGSQWRQTIAERSPPARTGAHLVFVRPPGALLLLGGEMSLGALNDSWVYDGATWVEAQRTGEGILRLGTSMAVDAAGRALLHGGWNSWAGMSFMFFSDAWRFNYDGARQAGEWVAAPSTLVGPARAHHALTFFPPLGRFVLFGGLVGRPLEVVAGDTWSYRPEAAAEPWLRVPTPVAPSPRRSHAMVYQANQERLVLFGGERQRPEAPSLPSRLFGDTWFGTVASPECGDGWASTGEQCDDGNQAPGDGCDSECRLEAGWQCSVAAPSTCWTLCGDGARSGTEQCEGEDSGGRSCRDLEGFASGALACLDDCTFDTSGCVPLP